MTDKCQHPKKLKELISTMHLDYRLIALMSQSRKKQKREKKLVITI